MSTQNLALWTRLGRVEPFGAVMKAFAGTFTNKMDAKGRVSVPAEFRDVLKTLGSAAIIARPTLHSPSIECAPLEYLERDRQVVQQSAAPLSAAQHRLRLRLFGSARRLSFDPEGRVMLPEEFIARANLSLKGMVSFAGVDETFEIWEPAALKAAQDEAEKRLLEQIERGDGGLG